MLTLLLTLLLGPFAYAENPIVIVALGDSLTDGYGIAKLQAYPQLVQDMFHKDGLKQVKVINAGISGSTSAGAEKRLKWFLKSKPQILVLALGANDGLRGVPPATTRDNLLKTIHLAKENKIKVVLAGMMLPPNYGAEYTTRFRKMFSDIASQEKLEFIPFLLAGVAGDKKLNQEDGIHPNIAGHIKVAELVYKTLKPVTQSLIKRTE